MVDTRRYDDRCWLGALLAFALLVTLCFWVYLPTLRTVADRMLTSGESAHAVVIPLAVIVMCLTRRRTLAASRGKGSSLALILVALALLLGAAAKWPFTYAYARDLSLVLVLAGLVAVVFGWKFMVASLPMLVLVMLAIPISSRFYLSLVVYPERYTMKFFNHALNALPSLQLWRQGTDLFFTRGTDTSMIGAGESYMSTRLLAAFAAVGIFVVYSRARSLRFTAFFLLLWAPIVFFCNLVRLLCYALMCIYVMRDPTGGSARIVAAIVSLLTAFILFQTVAILAKRRSPPEPHLPPDRPTYGRPLANRLRIGTSAAVLLAAGLFLTPATEALARKYSKHTVAVRRPLRMLTIDQLPSFTERWRAVHRDVTSEVGTAEYVNLSLKSPETLLTGVGDGTLTITYYSDPDDKVPHTPDVCLRQAGLNILKSSRTSIDPPPSWPETSPIDCGYMIIGHGDVEEVLLYCFIVEGRFCHTRRRARWLLAMPGNHGTYFCLIQARIAYRVKAGTELATDVARKLFTESVTALRTDYLPLPDQLDSH